MAEFLGLEVPEGDFLLVHLLYSVDSRLPFARTAVHYMGNGTVMDTAVEGDADPVLAEGDEVYQVAGAFVSTGGGFDPAPNTANTPSYKAPAIMWGVHRAYNENHPGTFNGPFPILLETGAPHIVGRGFPRTFSDSSPAPGCLEADCDNSTGPNCNWCTFPVAPYTTITAALVFPGNVIDPYSDEFTMYGKRFRTAERAAFTPVGPKLDSVAEIQALFDRTPGSTGGGGSGGGLGMALVAGGVVLLLLGAGS